MATVSQVPTLRSIAESLCHAPFAAGLVDDVGDASFRLVASLLALCSAAQLHEIERNSPHLKPDTEPIWRQLCINDFVSVRIAVEDNLMDHEPARWRRLHELETRKQEEKMAAVLERMRGAYKDFADGRATIGKVDGVQLAKRRKLNSMVSGQARPKTLMDKARVNSQRIKKMYAPKHKRPRPTLPTAARPSASVDPPTRSNPPASAMLLTNKRPRTTPTVVTVTKTVGPPSPGVKSNALGDIAREQVFSQQPDSKRRMTTGHKAANSREVASLPSRSTNPTSPPPTPGVHSPRARSLAGSPSPARNSNPVVAGRPLPAHLVPPSVVRARQSVFLPKKR